MNDLLEVLPSIILDIAVWAALCFAGRVYYAHHHIGREVPDQLVKLVQQAHAEQPVDLEWDIAVSREMNRALCAPLTDEQLDMLEAAEAGVFSRSVFCYLVSSSYKRGELSGVVETSVTLHSRYSKNDVAYPRTKLKIVVRQVGGKYPNYRWEVSSVEQIK